MPPKKHSKKSATELRKTDQAFIDKLKVGDRLFHFPSKGGAGQSFRESPSAEYTLYSVIDLPDGNDVTLMKAFDQKEGRKNFSRDKLLSSGDWWFNPAG
jgi:hypothetical protein